MDDLSMSFTDQATCRICRSEATPEEPLFHPCRCSGSIRNVHQECLVEWLSHSQKKHCELCKTTFRFTKLYDAHMPETLPWRIFIQRAIWDTWVTIFSITRTTFVAFIWLIVLPWIIRWAWRWMFWFVDAGWAREEHLRRVYYRELQTEPGANSSLPDPVNFGGWTSDIYKDLNDVRNYGNLTLLQLAFGAVGGILISIGIETFANATHFDSAVPWKQADSSIFSSLSYLSSLTPYAPLNRIILDIFEGQLITCTVIISFILIFLIREWVVQQQPLVNLDPVVNNRGDAAAIDQANNQLDNQLDPQVNNPDDRYQAVATRIADLRADIEADLENLQTLQDRMQAQRQGLHDARRPVMPSREISSRAAHIRRELEETNIVSSATPVDVPTDTPPAASEALSPPADSTHAPQTDTRPITNAGVDARLNIKWRKDVTPAAVLPPSDAHSLLTNEELVAELDKSGSTDDSESNPFAPDSSSAAIDVAAGADMVQLDDSLEAINDVDATAPLEEVAEPEQPRLPPKRTIFDEIADWFWDGIEANATPDDQVIVIDEQRLDLGGNEAPFVPVNHMHDHNHVHDDPDIDPEVAAAAQQAGVDQDLGEGAEEMEGLLELIGLRGPLIGMIQTSLFCLLLVASTVLAAVVIPYVWGKLVLSFIGSPVYFLIILPLRAMSFLADFFVDATLFSGGWILTVWAVGTEAVLASIGTFWPRLGDLGSYFTRLSNAALAEAGASGDRLRGMFTDTTAGDPFNFNEGILGASAHSHLALKELVGEVDAVMNITTSVLRHGAHIAITGDFAKVRHVLEDALDMIPGAPQQLRDAITSAWTAALDILSELKSGNIALPMPEKSSALDPALIYWNSVDRSLAVSSGYLALAGLAAIYVASNISVTSSPSGRAIEKVVRDSLRQAGGVMKVILIISIEMLVFPFYCGLLLDIAFLPLFGTSSLTTRLVFAATRPYIFCFVHWFLGTYYMFHFALFVGMCRKILRKGVLWFIRDPDDPTFHPVRDVLERNVTTQLRKIAFSALVYGALVILCLGGVIWSIGKVFGGIFPIVWRDTEPILEFPLDLFLYNFLTPLVIAFVRPSEGLRVAYAWWLRRCARYLRLSHFLFGQRMPDEEGHYVFADWKAMIHMPAFDVEDGTVKAVVTNAGAGAEAETYFVSDGSYVFTPCHDQYRPPKAGEMFFSVTDDNNDVEIVDQDGKKHPHWSKVYLPPYFKVRVMLFMVCLWIFSAFAGLCVTLLPLAFGRRIFAIALPGAVVNDLYGYSVGITLLGGPLYVAIKVQKAIMSRQNTASAQIRTTIDQAWLSATRTAKCAYVYGYVFVIQPLLLAGLIEMYLLMPFHTFLSLKTETPADEEIHSGWISYLSGLASTQFSTPKHDIHLAQDFALAVLFIRLLFHFVAADSGTRAAEALRRATKDGIWSPDSWLVTRYFIIPTLTLSSVSLLIPIMGSTLSIMVLKRGGIEVSPSFETLVYRFSYPAFEALLLLLLTLLILGRATTRWRARIRDEVYLVGERLHNFGEKKPPSGSKSILRGERVVS